MKKDNIVTQPYEDNGILYCKCGNDIWITLPNGLQECTKCQHTVQMIYRSEEESQIS